MGDQTPVDQTVATPRSRSSSRKAGVVLPRDIFWQDPEASLRKKKKKGDQNGGADDGGEGAPPVNNAGPPIREGEGVPEGDAKPPRKEAGPSGQPEPQEEEEVATKVGATKDGGAVDAQSDEQNGTADPAPEKEDEGVGEPKTESSPAKKVKEGEQPKGSPDMTSRVGGSVGRMVRSAA